MFRYLGGDLSLDGEDLLVKSVHERGIDLDAGTDCGIGEACSNTGAVGPVTDALLERREIVLCVGVLDMGLEFRFLTSHVQPAAQQIPCGAHPLRIDVSHREHPAPEHGCYLLRVDLVVLHLSAVDRFHVQRVTQHELDVDLMAKVRDPVPGENALHRQDHVAAVGLDLYCFSRLSSSWLHESALRTMVTRSSPPVVLHLIMPYSHIGHIIV